MITGLIFFAVAVAAAFLFLFITTPPAPGPQIVWTGPSPDAMAPDAMAKEALRKALSEPRELPTGMTAFEEWSDRIISGTCLPADTESQKFALATMLMHLAPTVDHETDLYFIKSLRKGAINQIAHAKMTEIKDRAVAKQAQEKASKNEAHLSAVPSHPAGANGTGPIGLVETKPEQHTPKAPNH